MDASIFLLTGIQKYNQKILMIQIKYFTMDVTKFQ